MSDCPPVPRQPTRVLDQERPSSVAGLNALIMLYPLFVMVISSFKTNAEIFTSPFALPTASRLANLEKVWTQTQFRALPRQFARRHRRLGRADPALRHDGRLCHRPLRIPPQCAGADVLPQRHDSAAEAGDHPALHPAGHAAPDRQLYGPGPGLCRDGHSVRRLHHDRFPARLPRELEESARIDGASESLSCC